MGAQGQTWFQVLEADGARVHVLPTRQFKTVTVKLTVRLPLTAERVTANALVPFVLRRGSRRLPTSQALARALEAMYGARLSVEVAKVGEVQLIEVKGEAVADPFLPGQTGGDAQLRALLQLLLEVLYDPATEGGCFVANYVDQERDILRRRIEGVINNKRQYAVHRLFEEMCQGEPFSLHRLGRLEDLGALTPQRLFEHYRKEVLGRRVEVAAVGPVEPARVAELVQQALERLTFRPQARLPEPPPRQGRDRDGAGQTRFVTEAQDVRQGVLSLGFRTGPDFASAQYPALLMYDGVLGGFPHSKLFVHVRERHSLAYFVYSRLEPTKGVLVISAGIDPSRRDQAMEIIDRQLAAMAAGEISPEELEATRMGTCRRLMVASDDPWSLLEGWSVGLVNGRQRPPDELLGELARVSRDMVVEVASAIRRDTVYFLTSRDGPGP